MDAEESVCIRLEKVSEEDIRRECVGLYAALGIDRPASSETRPVKRIYEDMAAGRLSPERFDKLSTQYEEEQKQVRQVIGKLQSLIDDGEQETHDLRQFLKSVRKYTDPDELTAEMLDELVEKIIVHAPDKSSGHRRQKIEIYYKVAGIIDIADDLCKAGDSRGSGAESGKRPEKAWL